jgi:hypothetical protein
VLSNSTERIYSLDEGVEEVELGLYLVKGDMMCVVSTFATFFVVAYRYYTQSTHRRGGRGCRAGDGSLDGARRADAADPTCVARRLALPTCRSWFVLPKAGASLSVCTRIARATSSVHVLLSVRSKGKTRGERRAEKSAVQCC